MQVYTNSIKQNFGKNPTMIPTFSNSQQLSVDLIFLGHKSKMLDIRKAPESHKIKLGIHRVFLKEKERLEFGRVSCSLRVQTSRKSEKED